MENLQDCMFIQCWVLYMPYNIIKLALFEKYIEKKSIIIQKFVFVIFASILITDRRSETIFDTSIKHMIFVFFASIDEIHYIIKHPISNPIARIT